MMQSLCHLDLTTVQKLAVDRILCQSGTDLFRERTVGEHDLPGYFIQPGRSGSFEENPYHIISYKHFFKTVLRTLQAGFDFFLSFSAQIMILAIELNIIEIFAGHGSDGDIVPAVALYSLAQLPTEFTSEMREGSLQIFEMEMENTIRPGLLRRFPSISCHMTPRMPTFGMRMISGRYSKCIVSLPMTSRCAMSRLSR